MNVTSSLCTRISLCLAALVLTLTFALTFAIDAQARPEGGFNGPGAQATAQGGFTGPGPALTTVQNAKTLADDTWISLKGKILQHNGDKRYVFSDATGTITVKIGRKAWQGLNVGPEDVVELYGEVDKDWGDLHIDVKQVRKAQ